jgi:hypothetical protein
MMNDQSTSLPAHWSAALPLAAHSGDQRRALTILEAMLTSHSPGNILLLVEQNVMDTLAMIILEAFLRSPLCKRVLLLTPPQHKARLHEQWEHALSSDDGRSLKEHFAVAVQPQDAKAQVCLATVLEIQRLNVHAVRAFCKSFDAMLVYDVPSSPGPGWNQLVGSVVAMEAWVIGVSSTLSPEEGEALFEQVIDTTTEDTRGEET